MDKRLKTKWIKALRSGDYMQGRALLRSDHLGATETFCCLGVLCEVAGKRRKAGGYLFGSKIATHVLPNRSLLCEQLDGDADNSNQDTLIEMNDHLRRSFQQIATWIERNL